jgi:hypothetical protein
VQYTHTDPTPGVQTSYPNSDDLGLRCVLRGCGNFSSVRLIDAFEHRPANRVVEGNGHVLDRRYNHGFGAAALTPLKAALRDLYTGRMDFVVSGCSPAYAGF